LGKGGLKQADELKRCRTTVWKDMVEKERRKNAATVDGSADEAPVAWYQSKVFRLAASIAVFAVLLSARPCTHFELLLAIVRDW